MSKLAALPTIPRSALTEIGKNGAGLYFVADASNLQRGHGWQGFPMGFNLPDNMGNGEPMIRTKVKRDTDGTVQLVKYTQRYGIVDVTIFND